MKIVGKHLIGGQWYSSEQTFRSDPYQGMGREYAQGGSSDINNAVDLAVKAFATYAYSTSRQRCDLLNNIASQLESGREEILAICCDETGLTEDRVTGEFTRTVNQLRYFADYILQEKQLEQRHDPALPERSPLPKPELRMVNRPIGPVAVFGASNFPLAFSTAGGDTAAALAAGCPVVVKGHAAHPGTGDIIAQCIDKAVKKTGVHSGVFSQVQSNTFAAGQALVQHPSVKAVGFTGSAAGGRHLFNLCAARPEPIPFFGELGSINPVFLLPDALNKRSQSIAAGWVTSLTFGAGQLCTNPGVVVLPSGDSAEQFITFVKDTVNTSAEHTMLSDAIAESYRQGHDRIRECSDTITVQQASCQRRRVTTAIFKCSATDWLKHDFLADEVFGPIGLVVVAESIEEMMQVARSLQGQLTCTLQMEDSDTEIAKQLLKIAEHKAGRIIANGFPTGVEVSDAMVHGGPYPASTNFGATSVGSLSIRRFLRPVCMQNLPDSLYQSVVM